MIFTQSKAIVNYYSIDNFQKTMIQVQDFIDQNITTLVHIKSKQSTFQSAARKFSSKIVYHTTCNGSKKKKLTWMSVAGCSAKL